MTRTRPAHAARWVVLAILASAWTPTAAAAQERPRRTVLAIHWGPEDFVVTPAVNEGIQQGLRTDPAIPIDYFVEYLESDAFPVEAASASLAGYIREKFRGRRIDVVIAIADPALRFVLDHRDDLFPGTPIVYSGVAPPTDGRGEVVPGVTAVLRGAAYAETLKLALALHPSTERVFVVARTPDPQVLDAVKAEFRDARARIPVTFVDEPTVARLVAAAKAVPPRSLIVYIFYTDARPRRQDEEEVARLLALAAPVPVYGTHERYLGTGVVGGVVRGTEATGVRVGELALEILRGVPAGDLPVEHARLVPTFDWRQLRRWGIDESRLPRGSIVQFRTATAWESYKGYIIGTIVLVSMQSLLIAGLVAQRARRRRVEETLRSSYERSRVLAGKLIDAEEATRADIARDLHDGVCQDLIGVTMAAASLRRSSGQIQDAPTQLALSMLHDDTRRVGETLRRLSHDLHPATLQLTGLASALKTHCVEVERRHGVPVRFHCDGDFAGVRPDVVVCLFRIAQESLRNAVIHANPRQLEVSLESAGDHVELVVSDDGCGLDVEAVRRTSAGLGLVSMEERARGIGATIHIVSGIRQGTTVLVSTS
jgi:signal transduction histidine kinase